tara:strand:- start:238 stop:393 length:156 start_codon:yes stop_codon:yes gene_type:complete
MKNIMVTPSILSTDFASAKLLKLLTGVKQTGCMFVPNISFGTPVLQAIQKH